MSKFKLSVIALSVVTLLTACDDGDDGADGTNGADGSNGLTSLVVQTELATGSEQCWLGGMQIDSGLDANSDGTLEASEVSDTSYVCNPDTFGSSGARLPYSVLRNDMDNTFYPGSTFEVRNGGYGSDLDGHPTNPMQFYALTDRGPNAKYRTAQEGAPHGSGKIFPTPDYTPRIGLFEVQANGSIAKISDILLKDRDGNNISGLPNTPSLGGTGEVPYNTDREVIRADMTQPYDADTNPAVFDDYGLDSEGLVAVSDGTFWVSDEYGPHIVHYSSDGVELERINPFAADDRNLYDLPAEFGNRWANRGMEGLTITPDESTLVGIMQSSLDNPDRNRTDMTRIVTVDLATGAISQYLYRQEKGSNSNSAIKAISDTQFLVLERDGAFFGKTGAAQKQVYKIDISNATDLESVAAAGTITQDDALGLVIDGATLEEVINDNATDGVYDQGWGMLANLGIAPVEKLEMVVDMVDEVAYPHDKMEGLWVIDDSRLGVLNDDDFATWSKSEEGAPLGQKYLDINNTVIDGNTLYIVDSLNLTEN